MIINLLINHNSWRFKLDWLSEVNEETWIVSDTHFMHANINKYEPSRLKAMQNMGFDDPDDFLMAQWNSVVGEGDLVMHLGDLFTKKGLNILHKLNGRIILILGNHDIPMINKLKQFELDFPDKLQIVVGVHPNVSEALHLSAFIKVFKGKKIMFSHYPLISDDGYMRGKAKETRDAMAEVFKNEKCDISVHGHVHTNDGHLDSKEIKVSIERMGFKPVKLIDILDTQ